MRTLIVLTAMLLGPAAGAQSFVGATLRPLCSGAADTLTFGFASTNDVVVQAAVAHLHHADTVFLPDGVPCGQYGCSYRSPLTFSDFEPGATIGGANDIRYVRLNMEHSYVKDLYINITCPNGQSATLMRFGGDNNSACSGFIPSSAEGWTGSGNMAGRHAFGEPDNGSNTSHPCDPNADGNGPGRGWNYCWSNNTAEGYTFASGDGIIYRADHSHGSHVDSSDVAAGTNFYHPDQSLASLAGCPLNGSWFIEVVDGYKQDNGYIFDWELALNPELLPGECELTGRGVEVADSDLVEVTVLNDSTYALTAGQVAADTEMDLRLWMANSCGDTVDTVVTLTLLHMATGADTVEAVGEYIFEGQVFTSDTVLVRTHTGANGCDSVHTRHVVVLHSVFAEYDTVACDPQYPIEWRGHSFTGGGTVELQLVAASGVDSIVSLTLVEAWSADTTIVAAICEGEAYNYAGLAADSGGRYEAHLPTAAGCDSTVRLDLTVHPTYDSLAVDTACATEGYWFEGELRAEAGEYRVVLATAAGCDSTLRLRLELKGMGLRADARAVPAVVTEEHPEVRLTDASRGAVGRLWTVDGKEYDEPTLYLTFPAGADSMAVQLVAYGSEQCTDTSRVTVRIDRSAVAVPNVFTPDGPTNSRWRIEGREVERMQVWVYDRRGLLVASLEGDRQWDGTAADGTPCPQGAYAFHAEYTTRAFPQRVRTLNGTILLIR